MAVGAVIVLIDHDVSDVGIDLFAQLRVRIDANIEREAGVGIGGDVCIRREIE